jgi:hypothetical protein
MNALSLVGILGAALVTVSCVAQDQAKPTPPAQSESVPATTQPVMPPVQPQPVPASLPHDGKLRILVTDHPIDLTTFNSVGRGAVAAGNHTAVAVGTQAGSVSHQTEDPRTVEIQADIMKACPANVIVTNDPDRADFVLVFRRREGARSLGFAGGGLVGLAALAGAKVDGASLFDRNGDMVFATKQRTVEKAIQEICPHVK